MKRRIIAAFCLAIMVLGISGGVFASGNIVDIDGESFILSLKSGADFNDGVYGGASNSGWIRVDSVDEEHDQSVFLGTNEGYDYTKEGPWVAIIGNKEDKYCAYEFEIYVNPFENGCQKLMMRYTLTSGGFSIAYPISIMPGEKITNGADEADFSFGTWHTVRMLFDCSGYKYLTYVDDMTTPVIKGTLNSNLVGVEFVRVTQWAENSYAAVDNTKYYQALRLPDGYTEPQLTLSQLSEKITESEKGEIQAFINTPFNIETVDFYVDGEYVYTASEYPYKLSRYFEPGDHTIYAVAKDVYGQSGKSDELVITSFYDTKPRFSHNLIDGAEYDKTDLTNVKFLISMTGASLKNGYVLTDDGNSVALVDLENYIDLSYLSIGKHTVTMFAENDLGETAEETVSITVNKTLRKLVASEDYNNGQKAGVVNGSGQFIRLETIRKEFKDSLLVGADARQDTSKEGAWMPIDLSNCVTTAIAEFDLYFSDINGSGIEIQLITSAGVRPYLLLIEPSGKIKNPESGVSVDFEKQRWYRVRVVLNSQTSKLSLYLDDELVMNQVPFGGGFKNGTAMGSMRLVSKLQGIEETYFAVDNVEVYHSTVAPTITKAESASGSGEVSSRDKEIKIYFSGALEASSVYASKFSISGQDAPEIVSCSYDSSDFGVTLGLSKALKAGETYRITAAENLVMNNGDLYGEKIYLDFMVKSETEYSLYSKPYFSGNAVNVPIKNSSSEVGTAILVVNSYTDGVLTSSVPYEVAIMPGENYVMQFLNAKVNKNDAEIYLWDGLYNPHCFFVWKSN